MITWYCTRKLLKALPREPVAKPAPATTILGDWHANVVETSAGSLFVFSNDKTLVSVAIPASDRTLIEEMFVLRIGNLLGMLGIHPSAIESEMRNAPPIQFARASDRSKLGHLQSIVVQYQAIAEDSLRREPLSLSDAELAMAGMPHLGSFQKIPQNVIRELFKPTS
nr:putative integron gene cassette protein [uncultured bacterium]